MSSWRRVGGEVLYCIVRLSTRFVCLIAGTVCTRHIVGLLLYVFYAFVFRVSEHAIDTCMDSRNLAICWSPTLLRPLITSLEQVTVIMKHLEEIVYLLIEQHGFFFYEESEV